MQVNRYFNSTLSGYSVWFAGSILLTAIFVFSPAFIHPFEIPKFLILSTGIFIGLFIFPIRLKQIQWNIVDIFVFGWILWQIVDLLIVGANDQSFLHLQYLILFTLIYLIGRGSLFDQEKYRYIAIFLIITATIQAVIGILQFFHLLAWAGSFFQGYETQAFGTFKNPNLLGAFLAFSLPFIYYLLKTANKTKRILWDIAVTLILAGLIVTKSRGAWVAALIGTGIYCWITIPSIQTYFQKRSASKMILILVIFLMSLPLFYSLYHLNPASASGRFFIWSVSWNMIRDHILTGVGFGNFGLHWLKYQGAYFAQTSGVDHSLAVSLKSAHFQYLQIFAESGLIGLLLFLILVVNLFKSFYSSHGERDPNRILITTTLFSSMLILFIHGLVEDVFTSVPILSIFLIILSVYVSMTSRQDLPSPSSALAGYPGQSRGGMQKYSLPAFLPQSADFGLASGVVVERERYGDLQTADANEVHGFTRGASFKGTINWNWVRALLAPVLVLILIQDVKVFHGELLWKKGQNIARDGDWARAIQYYHQAKSYIPKNHELDFFLGAAYSKTGRSENAIKYLLSSMNGFSDKNQYIALGKAYIDDKQYNEAILSLNRSLYFYPGLLSPHFWLSRVYYEQGDIIGARRELLKILQVENRYRSTEVEQIKADARRALSLLRSVGEIPRPLPRVVHSGY